MGPKKETRKGALAVNEKSTVVPSEDCSDSSTSKRKREDDLIIIIPPEAKSTPSSINAYSTAGSEAQSTSFSSITSTSSENQLVTSVTYHTRVIFKGRSYNQSHILFNSKKLVYLQDSLDPIDEASLQLNDD